MSSKSKNVLKIGSFILLVLFGVFIFVYGGSDDSPGAQLLGLVVAIIGIVGVTKAARKNKKL